MLKRIYKRGIEMKAMQYIVLIILALILGFLFLAFVWVRLKGAIEP